MDLGVILFLFLICVFTIYFLHELRNSLNRLRCEITALTEERNKRLFEILHVLERLEERGIHKGLESQILDKESFCSH